jgi:crotonobetainyl-CoA:carnitine CoA-transferase CaiB-like acyl-CoA transferase
MPGPLAGVRVIDLTTVVMGPFATQILAELGADVVKVESREGDNMRHVGPSRHPGMGHIFLHAGRGKRSLVLDLKDPRGRDALLALARRADVLVYNVRPQAMARLGLDYPALRAANPRILYVGCYGYSQRGPYAARPAYDDLIQAAAGVPSLLSRQGSDVPRYAPVLLADRLTGLHVVYAVTAALFHRERTGEGQAVEVPMFEAAVHFVLGDHLGGATFDPPLGDTGYARLLAEHRRPYATRDGHVCVLIYNDKQWQSFFAAIGEPERISEPRFATHANRAERIGEVYAFVADVMKTRTTAEWLALFERADIPAVRMNDVQNILADPHLAAEAFFAFEEHPTEGRVRRMGTPTHWSGTPTVPTAPAPRLGEHSRDVLREAGYGDEEIDALVAAGVTVDGRQDRTPPAS